MSRFDDYNKRIKNARLKKQLYSIMQSFNYCIKLTNEEINKLQYAALDKKKKLTV